ncbi:MAG: hypothetical protein V4760_14240 [Bdellovibrionota bacterium]
MKTIRFLKVYSVLVLTFFGHVASARVDWSQAKPHALSEAECTPVDLRPALGPARNQGNIGWCYANVTADLLTFQYRSSLRGKRVSAGYTALIYNQGTNIEALGEGGAVDEAMKYAAREGLCPETLESEVMGKGPKMQIKQKLEAFVQFKKLYDLAQTGDKKAQASFTSQAKSYRESNSSLFALKEKEIQLLLASTNQKNFPLEFAKMICRGHAVHAPPPYPVMSAIDKQALARFWIKLSPYVHQQLDSHKPVAVGYAAQFLSQANVPLWQFSFTNNQRGLNNDVSRHASLIVGRRWNGQRCEFILRNSWGTGCNYKNKIFARPDKCEAGHLFVTEEFLETQMYRIFYFSDGWMSDVVNRTNAVIN